MHLQRLAGQVRRFDGTRIVMLIVKGSRLFHQQIGLYGFPAQHDTAVDGVDLRRQCAKAVFDAHHFELSAVLLCLPFAMKLGKGAPSFVMKAAELCFEIVRLPRPAHQIIIRLYAGTERHPLPHKTGIFIRSNFRSFEGNQLLVDRFDCTHEFRRNSLDTGRERSRQETSLGESDQTAFY